MYTDSACTSIMGGGTETNNIGECDRGATVLVCRSDLWITASGKICDVDYPETTVLFSVPDGCVPVVNGGILRYLKITGAITRAGPGNEYGQMD